jgi:hypothetical protein
MSRAKYLLIAVILAGLLLGFEVVDENSIIFINSGETKNKFITMYNFSPQREVVKAQLIPLSWPNNKKPVYQVNLIALPETETLIPAGYKQVFPLQIEANKYLEKGEYRYWLSLNKEEFKIEKNGLNYQGRQSYMLPLIVVVK